MGDEPSKGGATYCNAGALMGSLQPMRGKSEVKMTNGEGWHTRYMFKLLSSLKRVLLPQLSVINGLHYSSAPAPGTWRGRLHSPKTRFIFSYFNIPYWQSALCSFKSYLRHKSCPRQLFGNNSDAMEMLLMRPQLNRGQMLSMLCCHFP